MANNQSFQADENLGTFEDIYDDGANGGDGGFPADILHSINANDFAFEMVQPNIDSHVVVPPPPAQATPKPRSRSRAQPNKEQLQMAPKRPRQASNNSAAKRQQQATPQRYAATTQPSEQLNDSDVNSIRKERANQVRETMNEDGHNMNWVNVDWKDHWYLFTLDKCLRFNMCNDCIGHYIHDSGKVKLVGGGYRLVSFVLCAGCVLGNNEVKKATKSAFPSKPYNNGAGGSTQ